MGLDCCVLFLHHRDDALTRAHLSLVRQHNSFPVFAIHADQAEHVVGALNVGTVGDPWHNADLAFVRWFQRHRVDAARYVLLEYDTLVTMPLIQFFGELFEAPAVVPHIRSPDREPEWPWFGQLPLLPPHLARFATGVSPMSGLLLSFAAMSALADGEPPPVFSELRVGTSLRGAGIPISKLPTSLAGGVHWDPRRIAIDPGVNGVYHPVKALIPGIAYPSGLGHP